MIRKANIKQEVEFFVLGKDPYPEWFAVRLINNEIVRVDNALFDKENDMLCCEGDYIVLFDDGFIKNYKEIDFYRDFNELSEKSIGELYLVINAQLDAILKSLKTEQEIALFQRPNSKLIEKLIENNKYGKKV